MEDHSILSKVFSRLIFRIMLGFSLYLSKIGNIFLNDDSMVRSSSISQKASLARSNDGRKVRLDSIHNDLGNKLVGDVAKDYRSEIFKGCSIFTLRDKAQNYSIIGYGHDTTGENLFAKSCSSWTCNIPKFLEKEGMEEIRFRGFQGFKGFKC